MDKQTKDTFEHYMESAGAPGTEAYWLKIIAKLLFYYIRVSK